LRLPAGKAGVALNHRIAAVFDRRKLCSRGKKYGYNDQAFRIERTEPENDQIENQTRNDRERAGCNQFMSLGLCHGTPPTILLAVHIQV